MKTIERNRFYVISHDFGLLKFGCKATFLI
jgi:hypothetical protein